MASEQTGLSEAPFEIDTLSDVLPEVIAAFKKLDDTGRRKLLSAISVLFGLEEAPRLSRVENPGTVAEPGRFSADHSMTPKEFLLRKSPKSDVERVACLAYYLTNYRDQPYFRTLDISKLNTEAAQIKFTNPAKAVDNATAMRYLTQATKGNKQLSAVGEMFVLALPDREAAQAAMASARPRKKAKRAPKSLA